MSNRSWKVGKSMISSMTGYGRYEIQENERKVLVEISSVNHRYLDLNIRMPRVLMHLEDEIRKAGGATDFVAVITYPDTKTQIPSHYSYAYTINGTRKSLDCANEEPGTKQNYNKDSLLSDFIMFVADNINDCVEYASVSKALH